MELYFPLLYVDVLHFMQNQIKHVVDVRWLDLGVPEAICELEVIDSGPIFVTMDSDGGNLYEQIKRKVSSGRIH